MSSGDVNFTVHLTFSCLSEAESEKILFSSSELNNLFVAQIVALRCTKRLMLYALLMRCPKLCCKFSEIVLGARPARSHAGSLTCTVKFIPQRARANPARLITFRVIFFFFHLIEFVKIERKSGKDSKVKLDLAKHSGACRGLKSFPALRIGRETLMKLFVLGGPSSRELSRYFQSTNSFTVFPMLTHNVYQLTKSFIAKLIANSENSTSLDITN